MTFAPMLARSIDPKQIDRYLADPAWYAQQKLDGIRIVITVEDHKVTGSSRSGKVVELPDEAIQPFVGLQGLWRFDGEFVGTGDDGVLWLFDMPNAGGIVNPDVAYSDRYKCLEATFSSLGLLNNPDIKLVDLARTKKDKTDLLNWCRDNNAEGVMFKQASGKYQPGARSIYTLKSKFTETIDCVVLEVGREGKESCAVGAFHNGVLTDIGSVKMTASQGLGSVKKGDVMEVRYLYVDKGMRLYQPVFLKIRDDKDPFECNTDQLKYTNKSVRKEN